MADKVAIVGSYMWTTRLSASLSKNAGVHCSTVSEVRPGDAHRLLGIFLSRLTLRVGFRPGQFRPRALLLDLICLLYVVLGGRLVFYWTGSDVQRTVRLVSSDRFALRLWSLPVARVLLRKSLHCVAAPWLVDELATIGVQSECFPFPTPTESFENLTALERGRWPEKFTVLSYVPDHNYQNYCGDEVVALARSMPQVDFRIMGGEGQWCLSPPENLKFLGWTDAMKEYLRCVVVLRAVRHDALGGTVREALLCGRYVLYTYPHALTESLPHPDTCNNFEEKTGQIISELFHKFEKGELPVNLEGFEWVRHNLSETVLAEKLAKRWV